MTEIVRRINFLGCRLKRFVYFQISFLSGQANEKIEEYLIAKNRGMHEKPKFISDNVCICLAKLRQKSWQRRKDYLIHHYEGDKY